MKRIKLLVATFAVMVFGVALLSPVASVNAIDPLGNICADNPDSEVCKSTGTDSANKLITNLVNTLLFIVGALATIMIIVGGVLYVTSSGDASRTTRAKNTLMYAIVGLVVAFVAYAIINWVINKF
jgi:hypothetical protein